MSKWKVNVKQLDNVSNVGTKYNTLFRISENHIS